MKNRVLEIKKLTKYYGNVLAVKNLSLSLNQGEVFGFIGPNGAGKSTTIRCIMNLINKNDGEILINGTAFDKDNISLKKLIGYLPSEIHLYDDLTVKEMLDYHESFYSEQLCERRKMLVKRLKIDETKKIEDLSYGNKKKLGIVLAFMHEPDLLILDEPTSGLDPIMQNVFFELIKEEKEKGTTIFYSTHILSEIAKICDRVGIIKDGKLLNVETIEELQNKNLITVTIETKQIDEIIKRLEVEVISRNNNQITFKNNSDINKLIKVLSDFSIDTLLINEPTLEEVLLHYYK